MLSIWRGGTGVAPMVVVGIGYPTEQAFDGVRRGFDYTPAVLQRNGLVVMRLTLSRNGESVEIMHQVDVLNTP